MKLSEKILKNVDLGYMYAVDGACKLVLRHSENHALAGKVEWVTIHDCPIKARFDGRIVLHRRGVVRLALSATTIDAKEATVDRGSENTKSRGIAVGSINFLLGTDQWQDSYHVNLLDGLISSDFTYQSETKWVEPEFSRWADYQIAA